MGQTLTPALKVLARTVICRTRELPISGEILVKVGDSVSSADLVARAMMPGELQILRIPEEIGVEPAEVFGGIKVREGDSISQGTLIYEHRGLFGLFKHEYKSPFTGSVEFVAERTAHVGVRLASNPLELDSYIDGKVISIKERSSVTIESQCALIQGIFGVGGERKGEILVLDDEARKRITTLPAEGFKKRIVVIQDDPTLEEIRLLTKSGAVGLVAGSISGDILREYLGYDLGVAVTGNEEIPTSVIVTEGFGRLKMSKITYSLLQKMDGRRASMNGATQVRAGAVRPELIVASMDKQLVKEQLVGTIEVGVVVRVVRVPYFGLYGVIKELPSGLVKINTGGYARVAEVELDNGDRVVVPRANLEIQQQVID